jgi:hypothetical protein
MKKIKSVFLTLTLIISCIGCVKENEDDRTETYEISDTNFAESIEDFFTVDYKEFYDALSPYGKWIQVSAKEIGLDINENLGEESSLIYDLIGLKSAYAQEDTDKEFNLFIWQPNLNIIPSESPEEHDPYIPYTNGEWIYTDAGWYFKAPTPHEELTSHYGRWTQDEKLGWVWLPGSVWSPAWVEWKENEDYVAWTPLPPSTYIKDDGTIDTPPEQKINKYVVIEKKHIKDPPYYKYRYFYKENKNKIMIKDMEKREGVMVKNKTIINKGPDVNDIEKQTGKKIEKVKIKKVKNKNEVGSKDGELSVYTPKFKKVKKKEKKKVTVSKPGTYETYEETGEVSESEETEDDGEVEEDADDKELKKEEKDEKKQLKKEEQEIKKESKKEEKELKKDIKKEEKEIKKEEKKNKKDIKKEEKDTKKEKSK